MYATRYGRVVILLNNILWRADDGFCASAVGTCFSRACVQDGHELVCSVLFPYNGQPGADGQQLFPTHRGLFTGKGESAPGVNNRRKPRAPTSKQVVRPKISGMEKDELYGWRKVMTQIGEGIAVTMIRLQEGKCVFCGKADHEFPKKDEIKPTNWARKTIYGVGGNFESQKKSLYPNNTSPPTAYRSEGHHCLAFSSFIVDARKSPTDRFAALNHYLKEKDYDPNNKNNTIDLPGRKAQEDQDAHGHFKEYEKAVVAKKPLQLHIGGHKQEFMNASTTMIRDVVRVFQRASLCDKPDDEFKQKLLDKIKDAEDKAFKKTAGAIAPWIAHPGPLREAEGYVRARHQIDEIKYPKL